MKAVMTSMSTNTKAQFWLTNNAGTDRLQIPVLPEQIDISHGVSNDTLSVAGLGEITIIQDRQAVSYKWDCHFPAVWHQGCCVDKGALLPPATYRDKIVEWLNTPKPIKFIATDCGINTFCTIEGFEYHEQGGDPDTLYYSIELKEYREVIVRQLDTSAVVENPVENGGSDGGRPGVVKTNGSRLMLRASNSTSSAILKRMPNGASLTVLATKGSWYKVSYGGITGYASSKWVQLR